jgi:transcriptional regulator with XRE-family HTH domain
MKRLDKYAVGRVILRHRLLARLSQAELSAKVGCSRNHISSLENGFNLPSFELWQRLITVLKISTTESIRELNGEPDTVVSIAAKDVPLIPPALRVLATRQSLQVSLQELNSLATFKPVRTFGVNDWLALLKLMRG